MFILIIISLVFSFIYIPYVNNNSTYVVVEDNTVWKKTGDKWTTSNIRNLKRLSFDEFYSFNTREYMGKTYLNYTDELEVYDNNFEKISLTNGLLSVKSKNGLKNKKTAKYFDDIDESDHSYIDEVLEKYSITDEGTMTALRYTIDLNNDGNEDIIYSISNFYNDEEKAQAFSIIFSVIDDNIEIINSKIVDASEELKEKALYLRYIADVDSDDNYELIILETAFGDIENDCNEMYKYNNSSNKFVKLIGC